MDTARMRNDVEVESEKEHDNLGTAQRSGQ